MAIRYAALLGLFLFTAVVILTLARLIGGTPHGMVKYHYFAIGLAFIGLAVIYYLACPVQILRKLRANRSLVN